MSALQGRLQTLCLALTLYLTLRGSVHGAPHGVRELVLDRCASEALRVALQEVDEHHHAEGFWI